MALIGLCICAGWSEPLLVAHTTLLEILCHGANDQHAPLGTIFICTCFSYLCKLVLASEFSHIIVRKKIRKRHLLKKVQAFCEEKVLT